MMGQVQESTPPKHGSFVTWGARISPVAPLIPLAFNVLLPEPRLRETKVIVGTIGILIIVAGFVLALVALTSVRKYGAKGIRGPAIAGVVINGVAILLSLISFIILLPALQRVARVQRAGYTRAEMETMPEVIPGSRKIFDETIGFRVEIPGDFVDNPQAPSSDMLYWFIRPNADGTNIAMTIQRLGGRISGPMGAEAIAAMRTQFPSGSEVERSEAAWKTYGLEVFSIRLPVNDLMMCNHSVQVPLNREAIQINVAAPDSLKSQSRELLALVLASLKGVTREDAIAFLDRDVARCLDRGIQDVRG